MVVLSHTLFFVGEDRFDPILQYFRTGYGDLGVNIFFVISGFLITKSWIKKNDIVRFCWARFLRVYPALWASTLLLVLACGVFFSSLALSTFITLPTTLSYVGRNFTILPGIGSQLDLPMAIGDWSDVVNEPLWTLPHELQMYGLVVVLGTIGLIRSRYVCAAIMSVSFIVWILADHGMIDLTAARFRLMFFFFAGASCLHLASNIRISPAVVATVILLCAATSAFFGAGVSKYILGLCTPVLLLWFGFYPSGPMRQFNLIGDYSYGIYIYGYPVQVLITYYYGHHLNAFTHLFLSLSATLVLAVGSWHLLESKALQLSLPAWLKTAGIWVDNRMPFLNYGLYRP
jgi:peptidoglycan/LPS O-acetylase OafA/YrhL